MAAITTKFGINDTLYTFDPKLGKVSKHHIICIVINSSTYSTTETNIVYRTKEGGQVPEEDAMTDLEVKDMGNNWLADRSISMFTDVGI